MGQVGEHSDAAALATNLGVALALEEGLRELLVLLVVRRRLVVAPLCGCAG